MANVYGKSKPSVALTLVTAVFLTVLLSLGLWQWRKIEPKNDWIESIQSGLSAEPEALHRLDFSDDLSYRRVFGEARPVSDDLLRLFGTNLRGLSGYHLYGLITIEGVGPVMASFGWVPFDYDGLLKTIWKGGRVDGVLLAGGKTGPFTPGNDKAANVWHWADLTEMARTLGGGTVYPYRLILNETQGVEQVFLAGQVRVNIPNDHFEYALTWFGLAAALMAVYLVFGFGLWQTSRPAEEPETPDQR